MKGRIVAFGASGVVVKPRFRGRFSIAYGELLTAERCGRFHGLRLHTRSSHALGIRCHGKARFALENELRRRGVRVVDCWGAILAPTLLDFIDELDREPVRVRQLSDDA